jgi:RimJ/RimL family protein N-acetyltransferase
MLPLNNLFQTVFLCVFKEMECDFQPLEKHHALAVLSWRYSPPYDFYNLEPAQHQANLDNFLNPQNNFLAILNGDGELEGFCSFGSDGRVRGGTYSDQALDIGMGIRPDLTGQGNGRRYAQAFISYATQHYSPSWLRVTIASFNQRAQRVWTSLGFELVETFVKTNSDQSFVVLVRNMEERSRK